MCGLVGFLGGNWPGGTGGAHAAAAAMGAAIAHRGPDASGIWIDESHRLAFAHNRLAIIDLSKAGEQPMSSPSGRYVIIYNGEIYNHLDLRQALAETGHGGGWRGHSDTETLLAGFEVWGVRGTIERVHGMFAFALWDREEKRLVLGRDRLGEKPLYYGWQGRGTSAAFLFGSELKALAPHPAFEGEIDRDVLTLYTRYGYVPAPHSIYRGIAKLPPGALLTLAAGQRQPSIDHYWSGEDIAERGAAAPLDLGPDEAVDALEDVLGKAVRAQMISDVPLGAFLSGGVDSSTIVALMQAQVPGRVKTFSIGFEEEAYDEARHAKLVAAHLGTDHTELYVTPREALDVIPHLPAIYDEPFADSSQIPTMLVSQLARRHVTVSLSGDGGDELFAGYNRHKAAGGSWRRLSRIPVPLRRAAARGLTAVSPGAWNRVFSALEPIIARSARMALPGDKIHKGAQVLASRNADQLYLGLVSQWREPERLVLGGRPSHTSALPAFAGLNDVEKMMAFDLLTYLPDDILVKVDRAAMSVSLETRVPFLDHSVVEFAWRLPLAYKLREGRTKWILRRLLDRHVPRELIDRPKMGFGVPIDSWLRGPLRDWAEGLLDEGRLRSEGYFDPRPVRAAWDRHLSGQANLQHPLWTVLMFQAWREARQASPDEAPLPRRAAG